MHFESQKYSSAQTDNYSPFPGWTRLTDPILDANENGPFDGLYALNETGRETTLATFKQTRILGGVLTGDMIGAGVGGALLRSIYNQIGVDPNHYNKVNLVHIANKDGSSSHDQDLTGEHTYLQSIFVPHYQEEFWKYAFRQYYLRHFLKNHSKEESIDLANAKVSEVDFSNIMFDEQTRKIVNDSIKANSQFLKDFSRLVAPRLLIGDFAVHSGNFGVANDESSEHLVATNFNAACKHLIKYLNPFQEFSTRHSGGYIDASNLEESEIEKNYYLEYGKEIRSSLEMAEAFIELGHIDKKTMKKMIGSAIDEQLFYDGSKRQQCRFSLPILKEFCLRIGMYHD